MEWLNPVWTYQILLFVQATHLLHHRLAKRHISFVVVITAGVLCVPPGLLGLPLVLAIVHLTLVLIQVAGSVWINKLSPNWAPEKASDCGKG